MKAVILSTFNLRNLEPVYEWTNEFLIPIVNKPIVEHQIELLKHYEILDIILILRDRPFESEKYFEKGERWGTNISYSLEKENKGISSSLFRLGNRLDETFIFLSANVVTNFNISDFVQEHEKSESDLTYFVSSFENSLVGVQSDDEIENFYPFLMSKKALEAVTQNRSLHSLKEIIYFLIENNFKVSSWRKDEDFTHLETIDDYWKVNQDILKGKYKGLIISPGYEEREGFWLGARTKIEQGVKIDKPVVIGRNCILESAVSIDENSIIGDNVIIDKFAKIKNSIIISDSYIGPHTSVENSIVYKNNLFNIDSKVNIYVGEEFILGSSEGQEISNKGNRFMNTLVAVGLLVIFSPLLLLMLLLSLILPFKKLFYTEERTGDFEVIDLQGNRAPKTFKMNCFKSNFRLLHKLPGLLNVIKGDIWLVGNTPLSKEELSQITEEWQKVRFEAPPGLFHFWEIESKEEPTWEEKIIMENFYAKTRNTKLNVRILMKSIFPF